MREHALRTSLNLSRVQPCDQRWKDMPVVPGGRHCKLCSKRIVDFTGMQHGEVAKVHRESEGPVCGMYRKDQLQLPAGHRKRVSWWSAPRSFVSLVSLLMLEPALSSANAQEIPVEQAHDPGSQRPASAKTRKPDGRLKDGPVLIRGSVWEQHGKDRKPVPFVSIFVKGTDLGTVTDLEGHFVLNLSELDDPTGSVVLVMSYVGYARVEREVALEGLETVEFIVGEQDVSMTAYAVQYRRPPLHKRIWMGLQRAIGK